MADIGKNAKRNAGFGKGSELIGLLGARWPPALSDEVFEGTRSIGESMDDDRPYLEKRMGHKPYRDVPKLGRIAIWLVLIAIACAAVLYWAVWANLIQ